MKRITKTGLLLGLGLLALVGCKKDKETAPTPPPVVHEEEVITTVQLTFTDESGKHPTTTAIFKDLDGDGGNGPTVFDTIRLMDSTTYKAQILVLNETESPADTISNEILEEAKEHLWCFTPQGVDLTVVRTDSDGTYEVGLESKWTTKTKSSGQVQVVLKHQPDVKDGTCSPGGTDVDINFQVKVL